MDDTEDLNADLRSAYSSDLSCLRPVSLEQRLQMFYGAYNPEKRRDAEGIAEYYIDDEEALNEELLETYSDNLLSFPMWTVADEASVPGSALPAPASPPSPSGADPTADSFDEDSEPHHVAHPHPRAPAHGA